MRALVIGAGQIGRQIVRDLIAEGHEALVLRRAPDAVPGARTTAGDAGDPAALRSAAARGAGPLDAIFHCMHAPYSAPAWRRALPQRERAVMELAAELEVPVVFPESVYAFGRGAVDLSERAPIDPASPLGEVRAELLAARAAHPARTASVIASDLIGPTATARSSVVLGLVLSPAAAGRSAWVLGDPDAPHAVTTIPDLSRAMRAAVPLAAPGGTLLIAPTDTARSQREMASDAARISGARARTVRAIPPAALALGGLASPMLREVHRQQYLWEAPSVLRPGRLQSELGLEATPWPAALEEWNAGRVPAGRAAQRFGAGTRNATIAPTSDTAAAMRKSAR
ncbi:NAD-dependent epimerase/dehydratase family protein [Leucobacter allii]|uniref:NAD-dependent epimerase/dehydratase family protein n=1 Tax=Leucobacter allii TaxID=2932247 RepID=UPI001FD2F128|nr:NAD-dependent epimerase/dehydratase family protein [Leucobacter allii]UOR02277.1 NAD-dependent epimerase/dehydratase family protein [Leucobacter allii]